MGKKAEGFDSLLARANAGDDIEVPDDPAELLSLALDEEGDFPGEPADTTEPDETAEKVDAEPEKTDDDETGKDDAAKKAADAEPKEPQETEPHPAVLRVTRQNLHRTQEQLRESQETLAQERARNAELKRQLDEAAAKAGNQQQQLQDKADEVAGAGKVDLESISDEELEALRSTLDDDAVEALEKIVKVSRALAERVNELETAHTTVKERDEATILEQRQNDIDTVPILAVLQASETPESDEQWARVEQYLDAVVRDPDWRDKSQREVYAEVGRRMEGYLGADTVQSLLGKPAAAPKKDDVDEVDAAIAAADDEAIPTSLSDMPVTGHAADQSELDRASRLNEFELQELFEKQLDAGKDVDELLARLSMA